MIRSEVLNAMDREAGLTPERVKVFLEELSSVSAKHGITIEGCGRCGSPYLSDQGLNCLGQYSCEEDGQRLYWEWTPTKEASNGDQSL